MTKDSLFLLPNAYITPGEYNEKLLNALEKELLNKYKTASSNLEVQALAWSCKAIAGSKKEKYKKTIETVASFSRKCKP